MNTIWALVKSDHPHATLSNIFTFMWCLWKSRNDKLFQRKDTSPLQVFSAAQAIKKSLSLEMQAKEQGKSGFEISDQCKQDKGEIIQGTTVDRAKLSTPIKIFVDAAWKEQEQSTSTGTRKAGIGIFMQTQEEERKTQIRIYALYLEAQSTLHAEALAIKLASIILSRLKIQEAAILTDNLTLAKAAAARAPATQPGHWLIRGVLAECCYCLQHHTSFSCQ